MKLHITSAFDGGNIEVINSDNPENIQLNIRKDFKADFFQWFYFRIIGAKDQKLKINIMNAGEASYPDGWENYFTRASFDRETWFQIPTIYKEGVLSFEITPEFDSVYFAYSAPFSCEQHLDLISDAQLSPLCDLDIIGHTVQGRPLELLKVGEDDSEKKKLWVIARQHPGEPMAEWFMVGLISRILDEEDPVSVSLLQKANLYIVPNMNVDGSILGNLRVNAAGANLNREWQTPSVEKSPEVYYVKEKMKEIGIDFNLDVHQDEGLPYVFISGIEGIPSFDEKLSSLTDLLMSTWKSVNPDIQDEHGYPKNEPGKANLTICSKNIGEEFQCLSQTLEMPFKQNDNLPDELFGWSSERSIKLGESLVTVLFKIVDKL
jgi:murein tripeptide amidase MpaA